MFKYETHLHTYPVSKCACVSVRENLEFYKKMGYDGVFITNHFIDSNINIDRDKSYEEKINFYFTDYEEALKIGKEIGIKVFNGLEASYKGTDFLVYGLDKQWFLNHPEIENMKIKERLELYIENGALVIHAHPFREAGYIDHIRLFPRSVNGVEVINACRTEFENEMARLFAEKYGLIPFAGSDNHVAGEIERLAGICCEQEIASENEFINFVKNRQIKVFLVDNKGE